jgi:preprotein translocase subunit YajC
MSVELSPSMARSEFWVRVKCGNNWIESRRFSFAQVSALPVYGVALIVVSLFIGVAVFVVVIVLQRKRLSQSQDKEIELSALLSNAKTDSLMKESTPIINTTTWQWTPTDDFSYKSLENLPINVDTSQLKFVEKGEPLEVEMNFNKELHLSSRSQQKRTKKSTVLTEKLISGTKVDIYAPTSPKYEVIVEPETLYIESGESHSVTVSVRMRMTTRCKVVLIVVLEQQKIYSAIEFKLESKMSTWIDLEEVQMSGEFLGGGG